MPHGTYFIQKTVQTGAVMGRMMHRPCGMWQNEVGGGGGTAVDWGVTGGGALQFDENEASA